jgi:hypothetical protein
MKKSIVQKLARHLSVPIVTEPNAVYLLCEVRKLFHKGMPLSVDMCANWALHVELDRNRGVKELLKNVDDFVGEFAEQGNVPMPAPIFRELSFVGSFRQDLRGCLASEKLPTKLCDDDTWWFAFIQAYAGVIDEGALVCNGAGFQNIKRLVFTKGRQLQDADLPFAIDWDIVLRDDQHLKAAFHSIQKVGEAIVWGFTIPPRFVSARRAAPLRKVGSYHGSAIAPPPPRGTKMI